MKPAALLVAAALLTTAPAASAQTAHPLAGKIVDTRSGTVMALTDPALARRLFPCPGITILGEVHDNPGHHDERARLIGAATGLRREGCTIGGFVFEHIAADQRQGLDEFYAFAAKVKRLPVAADVFRAVGWDKSGWPPADIFRPLFDAVLASRRPIVPGNPDRALTRKVAKEGLAALPPEANRPPGLDRPLPDALQDDLLGELEASHCGLMPKTAFTKMAEAQRLRDATMADAARRTAGPDGAAVVLTGNGHARRDRGIPLYLAATSDRPVVVAAFLETDADKTDAAAYITRDAAGRPLYDFIAFAPPAARDDPCEQMRRHMKK